DGPMDQVEVRCESQPAAGALAEAELGEIGVWVQHRIKTRVGISTRVVVLAPDSIQRTLTGKARRVIDVRARQT
ncbi:MAG: phenylacetate--CoA ligase, partial [Polaromonas sp.]|nr:phenylacetate--CoA ligase [Polaromonas sp.]